MMCTNCEFFNFLKNLNDSNNFVILKEKILLNVSPVNVSHNKILVLENKLKSFCAYLKVSVYNVTTRKNI